MRVPYLIIVVSRPSIVGIRLLVSVLSLLLMVVSPIAGGAIAAVAVLGSDSIGKVWP